MAEGKKAALGFLRAIPGVISALARFTSAPAMTISAPIGLPDGQPTPQRASPSRSDAADPAAAAAVAEALATLEGKRGPGLRARSPRPETPQAQSQEPQRRGSEALRIIADTQDTLTGKNGPGAHALPSWPSSPPVAKEIMERRRNRVRFGQNEAGLEGLRERTLAEKKADFHRIKPMNGALPLPSWVTSATPSSLPSSTRGSTSSRSSQSTVATQSTGRSDGATTARTSISSASSARSVETTGHAGPSEVAAATSITMQRATGLRVMNLRAPGRTADIVAYQARQVSIQTGLKPTQVDIAAPGHANSPAGQSGKATIASPERLFDRGERSRERDSLGR